MNESIREKEELLNREKELRKELDKRRKQETIPGSEEEQVCKEQILSSEERIQCLEKEIALLKASSGESSVSESVKAIEQQKTSSEKSKKRIAVSFALSGMIIVCMIIIIYSKNKCNGKENIDPITCMEFVLIQGKEFEMGCIDGDNNCLENEKIKKGTEIIKGFWIGKYEVTQGQWKKVMSGNPASFQKGDDYPIETVSWNDIQEFIRRLNEKTGRKYRLPTEAEWEFVCRNRGANDIFSGGKDLNQIGNYAWYGENSRKATQPVGTKLPNDLGVYDMSGNAEEWCQDVYNSGNIYPPGMEPHRVIRGGGWNDSHIPLRCTFRRQAIPAQSENTMGFRLARDCYLKINKK